MASLNQVVPVLKKHGVEFMVIGGTAVAYHGYARLSHTSAEVVADLDFWYKPETGNYLRLLEALKELEVDISDFEGRPFDPKKSFLKIPHTSFHTDFLPQIPGVESFRECARRVEKLSLGNLELDVIGYEDLIMNKRALNRPIDREDIENLKKNRSKN